MSNDLTTFDSPEPVELSLGGQTLFMNALRRPLLPIDGVERVAWHMRIADLHDVNVAVGNTLRTLGTTESQTWTIVQIERLVLGTRLKLICELATV